MSLIFNMISQKPRSSERGTSSKNAYRLNANRAGTEQHRTDMERIRNGHRTDTERERNGYRTGTGTRVEQKQNAFCQAFPVRFLLIGTVVGAGNNCFVLVACKYREIFYFLVTKGNLTLLFFTSK